jgi:hypothetical protein
MKNIIIIVVVAALLLLGSVWWSRSLSSDDSTVVSRNGIHWHPELEIYVRGKKVEIPHNVGLTGVHSPIHTHEDLPIIHLEFEGLVREDDVRLGRFFKVWGRDFMSFGTEVRMTVNGRENTELENYIMRHEDKIELRYE